MRTHLLTNLSLSIASAFFLSSPAIAEHSIDDPNIEETEYEEHPTEHDEHPSDPPSGRATGHKEHPRKQTIQHSEQPYDSNKETSLWTRKREHRDHFGDSDVQFEKRKFVNKADIAKGIKRHIKSSKKEGGGVYRMDYKGTELDLRLRKVHKDKLARLDSGLYFACTDFDGSDGNTYDVDFFLRGIPEAMEVTEKAVHKINGSPLYTWRQKPDGKWVKLWSAPSAPVHRSLLFRR